MFYYLHFIDEKDHIFNLIILQLVRAKLDPRALLIFYKTKMPLFGANSAPVLRFYD